MSPQLAERFPAAASVPVKKSSLLVRSKAPLRISFCGGGTDVAPYPERFGGRVLSCTIDKYAYVTLRARADSRIAIKSLDYGIDVTYDPTNLNSADSKMQLVEAIIRRFDARGVDIFMHCDAPPGSGLGSSSAMIVALCAALARLLGREVTRYELADLAYRVEREDLAITGGMQDQYAAAFGGFNYIEFVGDGVVVNPLRISSDILNEAHYHLMLCYTGATRSSSQIVSQQARSVVNSDEDVLSALHCMKEMTEELKRVLLLAKLPRFGEILHEAWLCKKRLAPSITNSSIDDLYGAALANGAWGGKILGAGGGGYLLVALPFNRRVDVSKALEALGGKMTDFQFDTEGVRTWSAPDTALQ